jgi:hypothetical protein
MSGTDGGPLPSALRDWLAAQRPALNQRFRLAARQYPRLDAEAVLRLTRDLLPPLASEPDPNLPALLDALFDLILLHAGRGTLTPDGGRSPAVGVLLRESFPALRPMLLAKPRSLPGALSNAVENSGGRGVTFARTLPAVAAHPTSADELLDAGAVLAWRLGDARLRPVALAAAAKLPPDAVLAALGLPDRPPDAAPALVAALTADGWHRPDSPDRPDGWSLAARLGNFRGFDGHFDEPPRLLDGGPHATRHRFWVRCGRDRFRIDADVFGWVCQPDAAADYPDSPARVPKGVPVPAAATSAVTRPDLVAFTRPDSFRVSVMVPS